MALTVGIATVMDAREVILAVTGQKKAMALSQCIENGVNHFVRPPLPLLDFSQPLMYP